MHPVAPGSGTALARPCGAAFRSSEFDADPKPGLMSVEIDQVETRGDPGRAPPHLKIPGEGREGVLPNSDIQGRAEVERSAGQGIERGAVVVTQIAGLGTEPNTRTNLGGER